MPTAPKVVSAILFAFIAWAASSLVRPYLPDGTQIAWMHQVCAAVGFVAGWVMSGARAGYGIRPSVGYGFTTMALVVFWCLFLFAGQEALERSMARRYDGPIEAIGAMIKLMLEYGTLLLHWDVLVWLVISALFGGVVTELSAREWA